MNVFARRLEVWFKARLTLLQALVDDPQVQAAAPHEVSRLDKLIADMHERPMTLAVLDARLSWCERDIAQQLRRTNWQEQEAQYTFAALMEGGADGK